MKLDGIPFSIVLDSIYEIKNVMAIPISITIRTRSVDNIDAPKVIPNPLITMVDIVINNGNLPLHGTKALVNMAINFSLVELIIRHPTTPAALQPNPMHMVVTRW